MSKYWSHDETGATYNLTFISKDNLPQNILSKIKKSNKVRQYRKRLIFVFANVLSASAKKLFLHGRVGTRLCTHAVLRYDWYFCIS